MPNTAVVVRYTVTLQGMLHRNIDIPGTLMSAYPVWPQPQILIPKPGGRRASYEQKPPPALTQALITPAHWLMHSARTGLAAELLDCQQSITSIWYNYVRLVRLSTGPVFDHRWTGNRDFNFHKALWMNWQKSTSCKIVLYMATICILLHTIYKYFYYFFTFCTFPL